MKRLVLSLIFLFTVSFSSAANKMSMVTYFPVPYVAYSQVSVDQQLDVGLTDTCTMNLGCRESGTNLNANAVNLKSGKLELNQGKGVLGNTVTLGSGSGNGQIKFSNVRIQGGTIQSMNANAMNVKELKLFGHKFPPCKGKGDGSGEMKWAKLKLQGSGGTDDNGELYLVCGETTLSDEKDGPSTCSDDSRGCVLPSEGDQAVATWGAGLEPCPADTSSFIGKCYVWGSSCSREGWKGSLTWVSVSGQGTDNCGGAEWNLALDEFGYKDADSWCRKLCRRQYEKQCWFKGYKNGEDVAGKEGTCIFYNEPNPGSSWKKFTLSCSYKSQNGSHFVIRTCK